MLHGTRRVSAHLGVPALICCASLGPVSLPSASAQGVVQEAPHAFTSPAPLLLPRRALPHGFRYRGSFVQHSVQTWDGGIAPVMAIDQQNGWLVAAQESALDPRGFEAMLSVQLFETNRGARRDFSQFFTNAHPQTRFEPDTYWLGGKSVHGVGDVATLYHMLDKTSRCPRHLTVGLSFVFRNALFSAGGCTQSLGDRGVLDLGRRLLQRARKH